jgi:predicted DNA-binding protein
VIKKKPNKVKVTMHLTVEQVKELKKYADKLEVSAAFLVRESIKNYLEKLKKKDKIRDKV